MGIEMPLNPLLSKAARCLVDRGPTGEPIRYCLACGSRASTYAADGDLVRLRPASVSADYWCACDNADCVNAEGGDVEEIDWASPQPWRYEVDVRHPGGRPVLLCYWTEENACRQARIEAAVGGAVTVVRRERGAVVAVDYGI